MDQNSSRPNKLDLQDQGNPLPWGDFGHLSPSSVVFRGVPKNVCNTKDQASEYVTQSTDASTNNTQTNTRTNTEEDNDQENNKTTERLSREISRDDTIRQKLEQHKIYISHCVKPDDIILYLHCCFSDEQILDVQTEKNPLTASKRAVEMLLHNTEHPGRFAALRDALDNNDGYPKIVRILDGVYAPEDQDYVKVVELFAPEIIVRLEPTELSLSLLSKGVFKPIDREEIMAEEKNHGKMRASCVLLMFLPRRAVDWFRCFLRALIECDLDDIAEMLDPDLYKDIKLRQKDSQVSDPRNVARTSECKAKPKTSPKPQNKGSLFPGTNKAVGINNPTRDESVEHTDGVVVISDFDTDKVQYLAENVSEREQFETCMADCDAEVNWPDIKRGKYKIVLRSISKDNTDREIWLRKKNVWCKNAKIRYKQLEKTAQCKQRCTGVPKILSGRDRRQTKSLSPKLFGAFQNMKIRGPKEAVNTPVPEVFCSETLQKCAVCELSCGRSIWIVKGSLVDLEVDVMVNTTDNHLSLTTGLAETISIRGGETVRTDCARFIEKQRSIDEGEVVVTDAGDLPAKIVIHVNSPVWRGGDEEEDKVLKGTVMKALMQASQKDALSIALPAISCGTKGFLYKTATELIVRAVKNFFREEQTSSLKHVYLVDVNSRVVSRFREALTTVFGGDEKCYIKDY